MTPELVKEINQGTLTQWMPVLCTKHATPILIVACGHDHKAGEITVMTREGVSDDNVLLFLSHALRQLERQIAERKRKRSR